MGPYPLTFIDASALPGIVLVPARGYGLTIRKARPSKAGFLLFHRYVFFDVLGIDYQIDDRPERAGNPIS